MEIYSSNDGILNVSIERFHILSHLINGLARLKDKSGYHNEFQARGIDLLTMFTERLNSYRDMLERKEEEGDLYYDGTFVLDRVEQNIEMTKINDEFNEYLVDIYQSSYDQKIIPLILHCAEVLEQFRKG